jgi:uncharacterized membrane protein
MQRRQQLLAKISVQRGQMAELGEKWQTPLRLADQAWVAAGFLRAHSVLLAGFAGLVGLVVVRRRGVSVLVQGAVRVWKVYRYVDGLAKKMTSRP